jgi:hypothetical protein
MSLVGGDPLNPPHKAELPQRAKMLSAPSLKPTVASAAALSPVDAFKTKPDLCLPPGALR